MKYGTAHNKVFQDSHLTWMVHRVSPLMEGQPYHPEDLPRL